MKRIPWGMSVALVCLASMMSTAVAAKGRELFLGTWTMNAAASDFHGGPAATGGKVTIASAKGGIKVAGDITYADGRSVHYEYSGPQDGSELPVTGTIGIDSVTMLRPDAHTAIRTDRKGGKVVAIMTVTLAADGKSFSATRRPTNPAGGALSTTVWTRKAH